MAKNEEEWSLYLDESGDFRGGSPSCVAGLAIRERESVDWNAELRQRIQACFPLVRWPPHAANLNIPVSRAAACMLAPAEADDEAAAAVRHACAPAIEALTAHREAPEVTPLLRQTERGWSPSFDALASADAWLRTDHIRAHGALKVLAKQQDKRFLAFLRELSQAYGPDDAFLIAADHEGAEDGGYLVCLETLMERACALLRGGGEERVLRFRISTRDEFEPLVQRKVPVDARRLVELSRRAMAAPTPLSQETCGVRFVPLELITTYREHAHPGVVIADFLANRLRRGLRSGAEWPRLRARASQFTNMPVEAWSRCAPRGRRAPTVAHDGEPRRWLTAFFRGEHNGTEPASGPAWARQQALLWSGLGDEPCQNR